MAAEPAVCPQLHLPLQAGSDRILALMHRGYTAARYLERLAAARAAVEDLAVTTDIIVGFPGETEADFERTLEVVAEAGFDSAYTFIYSPRPGTEAADSDRRDGAGRGVGRAVRAAARGGRAQRPGPAPGPGRPHRGGPGRGSVQAGSGRRSAAAPPRASWSTCPPATGALPAGTWADVRITRAAPHFLVGELLAVTARPTHRTRIPVVAG